MQFRYSSLSTLILFFLSACATPMKSTLLGAGIGSVVGGTVGLLATDSSRPGQRTGGVVIGLAAGGLVGALVGRVAHQEKARKEEVPPINVSTGELEMLGAAQDKGKRPRLSPAQVKVHYVEDQIKDGTFVPAHFEYEISSPAHWEPSK